MDDLDIDLEVDLDNYLLHPQPQRSLRIVHTFVCKDRTIEHVCEETVPTEDGVLRQEQLIWCIKQQQHRQHMMSHTHFKLRGMFLYNMDLEAEDMRDFLETNEADNQFLTPISAVENVVIQPTIPMFASLNALHIIYESSDLHPSHNQSKKRVIIRPHPHLQEKQKQKQKHKHTRRTQ